MGDRNSDQGEGFSVSEILEGRPSCIIRSKERATNGGDQVLDLIEVSN